MPRCHVIQPRALLSGVGLTFAIPRRLVKERANTKGLARSRHQSRLVHHACSKACVWITAQILLCVRLCPSASTPRPECTLINGNVSNTRSLHAPLTEQATPPSLQPPHNEAGDAFGEQASANPFWQMNRKRSKQQQKRPGTQARPALRALARSLAALRVFARCESGSRKPKPALEPKLNREP